MKIRSLILLAVGCIAGCTTSDPRVSEDFPVPSQSLYFEGTSTMTLPIGDGIQSRELLRLDFSPHGVNEERITWRAGSSPFVQKITWTISGKRFSFSEESGAFSGSGEFTGEHGKWTGWKYRRVMADGGIATGSVLLQPDRLRDEAHHEAGGILLRLEGLYKPILQATFDAARQRVLDAPVEKYPLFGSGSQPVTDRTLALWLIENLPLGGRNVPFVLFVTGDRGWHNKRVLFSSSPQQADVRFKWSYSPVEISLTFKPHAGSLMLNGKALALAEGNVLHATLGVGGTVDDVRIVGSTHLDPERAVESALQTPGVREKLK